MGKKRRVGREGEDRRKEREGEKGTENEGVK